MCPILEAKIDEFLDYVFSINPYPPQMSEVEDALTRLASTPPYRVNSMQELWDSIGATQQYITVAQAILIKVQLRDNISIIYQTTSALKDLHLRLLTLTQQYALLKEIK